MKKIFLLLFITTPSLLQAMECFSNSAIMKEINQKTETHKVNGLVKKEESLLTPVKFQLTTGETVRLPKMTAQKSKLIKSHLEDRGTEELIKIPIACSEKEWNAFWQCTNDAQELESTTKSTEAITFLNLHNYLHMNETSAQKLSTMLHSEIVLSKESYEQEKIKRYIWMSKVAHDATSGEILKLKYKSSGAFSGEYIKTDGTEYSLEYFNVHLEPEESEKAIYQLKEQELDELDKLFFSEIAKIDAQKYEEKKNIIKCNKTYDDRGFAYNSSDEYQIIVNKYPEKDLTAELQKSLGNRSILGNHESASLISGKTLNIRGIVNDKKIVTKKIELPLLPAQLKNEELINNICWSKDGLYIFIATTARRLLSYKFNRKSEEMCIFLKQRQCNQEITALGDWPQQKTIFVGFKNGYILGLGYNDIDAKREPRMVFEKDNKPIRHIAVDDKGSYMIAASSNNYTVRELKNIDIKEQEQSFFFSSILGTPSTK